MLGCRSVTSGAEVDAKADVSFLVESSERWWLSSEIVTSQRGESEVYYEYSGSPSNLLRLLLEQSNDVLILQDVTTSSNQSSSVSGHPKSLHVSDSLQSNLLPRMPDTRPPDLSELELLNDGRVNAPTRTKKAHRRFQSACCGIVRGIQMCLRCEIFDCRTPFAQDYWLGVVWCSALGTSVSAKSGNHA